MRDTERLRNEAGQLLADADKANGQGKSELAERLQARAAQRMEDIAASAIGPALRLGKMAMIGHEPSGGTRTPRTY